MWYGKISGSSLLNLFEQLLKYVPLFSIKFNPLIMELVPPHIFDVGWLYLFYPVSQARRYISKCPAFLHFKYLLDYHILSVMLTKFLWHLSLFLHHCDFVERLTHSSLMEVYWPGYLTAPHLLYKAIEGSTQNHVPERQWGLGMVGWRDAMLSIFKKSISDDTRQAGFQILSLPLPVVSSQAGFSLELNLTVFDFEIIIHTS